MNKYLMTPRAGDHIKTINTKFKGQWKGKIRRHDTVTGTYLIEWKYTGGLPTDICTWVFNKDLAIVKRPKAKAGK